MIREIRASNKGPDLPTIFVYSSWVGSYFIQVLGCILEHYIDIRIDIEDVLREVMENMDYNTKMGTREEQVPTIWSTLSQFVFWK